jgi:cell division transport system permease protein
MMANLRYFVGQTFSALKRSAWSSLLTSSTICLALLIPAFYVTTLQNLESLTLVWGRSANIVVVLADGLSPEAQDTLDAELSTLPGVSKTHPVSPEEALTRFKARGPKAAELVEGVSPDILPSTIEITLATGFAELKAIENLAAQIQTMSNINEVDYGQGEFAQLENLVAGLRYGGVGIGLLIFLATSLIVANTIRLNVYAHRDEISILRLVGATHWFIRLPFILEGAFWGLTGGLLASALLWASQQLVAPQLSLLFADTLSGMDIVLFSTSTAFTLVATGLVLGTFGSAMAVRRFLDADA